MTSIEEVGNSKFISSVIKIRQNKSLKITGVYRCHTVEKEAFIESLREYLNNNAKTKNHIIIGDFNINLLDTDTISTMFLNSFLDMGYLPFFNSITRPSDTDGSCIDNMFVKYNFDGINSSYTYANVFADHYPILLTIEHKTSDFKSIINYKKLVKKVNEIDWTEVLISEDLEEATDILIKKIQEKIECSKFLIKLNRKHKPRTKWITPGLIKSCNTKEKLYKEWKLHKNNSSLKEKYIKYCKVLDKLIKTAKNKYEQKAVSSKHNDSKKLWQYINEKLGKKQTLSMEIDSVTSKNCTITNAKEIADAFV